MLKLYLTFLLFSACATESSIVPAVNLATTEDGIELVSPTAIIADVANNQIVVVNSNERVFASTGSLATLSVTTTDTTSPQLAATAMIESFNFAGRGVMDGSHNLYIPFRDDFLTEANSDTLALYSVADGALTLTTSVATPQNPFGIVQEGSNIYIVSEDTLSVYDVDLNLTATISLTSAETLEDTIVEGVFDVVVDASRDLAVVSNLSGRFLLVNLATGEVEQSVEGPESTRDLVINGDLLYILDGVTESVWVYDLSLRTAPTTVPEELDSSVFLIDVVAVGTHPYGLHLDISLNRLYVANSGEDSVSVIDTQTRTEIARVVLDNEKISADFLRDCDEPVAVTTGTFSATDYVFVACYRSNAVAIFLADDLVPVEIFPNVAEVSTQDNDFDEEDE